MSEAKTRDRSELRAAIVASAREWLDVPWRHQGRLRESGIDCIGLLVCAVRGAGLEIDDVADYSRNPNPHELLRELTKYAQRVSFGNSMFEPTHADSFPIGCSRPGDVLVFWSGAPHLPRHVGFRTDVGVIHTWREIGHVVEHAFDDDWTRRLHSVWRLKAII
jgi:cell wall-associated NlpC family hydrolase